MAFEGGGGKGVRNSEIWNIGTQNTQEYVVIVSISSPASPKHFISINKQKGQYTGRIETHAGEKQKHDSLATCFQ